MLNQKQDLRAELLVAIAPAVTQYMMENHSFAKAEEMIASKIHEIAEAITELEIKKRIEEDEKHDK